MIQFIKTLLYIVRNYSKDLTRLNRRCEAVEGIIRERTDIAADVSLSKRGINSVIVLGRFRGCDYVQTFQLQPDDLESLIKQLQAMEKFGKVRLVDAPPQVAGVFKRELQW